MKGKISTPINYVGKTSGFDLFGKGQVVWQICDVDEKLTKHKISKGKVICCKCLSYYEQGGK